MQIKPLLQRLRMLEKHQGQALAQQMNMEQTQLTMHSLKDTATTVRVQSLFVCLFCCFFALTHWHVFFRICIEVTILKCRSSTDRVSVIFSSFSLKLVTIVCD